jgi:hypothetical protein
MQKPVLLSALIVLGLVGLGGCSRKMNSNSSGGGSTAPFSMVLTDAPQVGGDVLSFQIQITGAVLQPGNVSLLNTPLTVELTQLQAETGFLSSPNVPTGSYTSLTVTFANPSMTILNETGGTITGTSCTNGSICQLTPALVPSTVTFTGTPLLTLIGNTPAGVTLDVSLRNLIQNDFSLNPLALNAITITPLPSVALTSPIAELDEVVGQVTSKGTNQFNLTTTTGQVFSVAVDNNTTFSYPANICPAQTTFACVTTTQFVEVDVSLLGNGSFLAKSVVFEDDGAVPLVEGALIALGPGNPPTQFQMIVENEIPIVTGVAVGNLVTVTLQNPTTFQVDANGLTIPGGLSFATASDLLVGQEIQVRVSGAVITGPPISFPTNRVALRMAQITAPVASINIPNLNFTTMPLPSRFPVGSSILVQTFPPPQTEFVNVTDLNQLAQLGAGTVVSVKGPLFNTPGQLQIGEQVAKRVLVRSSSGP